MAGTTDLSQWQTKLEAFAPVFARILPLSRLKWLISAVLLLWLANSVAAFVWFSMPEPDTKPIKLRGQAQQSSNTQIKTNDSAKELAQMQTWQWFGKASEGDVEQVEETPVVQPGIEDGAAETRLRLILRGVVASSDPKLAIAIIENNNKQQRYKIGDKIQVSGRVSLAKVLPDRVILDNGGRFESLFLFDKKKRNQVASTRKTRPKANEKKVLDHRKDKALSEMAKNYREKLLNNPTSLADVIRVSIAKDAEGKVIGYKVRPGSHRKEFQAFGFKPNDIVTSVNGVELTDPAKALELYRTMRSATEADLIIKRGNEEISMLVGVNADADE